MNKVKITVFTDPMMGISYEMEPVFETLKKDYGERLSIEYVMSGLVRDIRDFMTLEELRLPEEEGIAAYNQRLAKIYLSEQSIGNRPMHMEGFRLFDKEHRSSYPLNIAYEAVKHIDETKAERFLKRLAYATVVQTRQTTKQEEIIHVVQECGIDVQAFTDCLKTEQPLREFQNDLSFRRRLGIDSLPAYLVETAGKSVLVQSLLDAEAFKRLISAM